MVVEEQKEGRQTQAGRGGERSDSGEGRLGWVMGKTGGGVNVEHHSSHGQTGSAQHWRSSGGALLALFAGWQRGFLASGPNLWHFRDAPFQLMCCTFVFFVLFSVAHPLLWLLGL